MALRFEFDPVNKILLLRREGRLTEELMTESLEAFREYWAATNPSAGIDDFSEVTEVVASTEFVRQLAHQEQAGDATKRPRVIVAPTTVVFGLARMFQILGDHKRPDLHVVHTLVEAFAALGVESPHFEPLE